LTSALQIDSLPPPARLIPVLRRTFSPDQTGWDERVEKALSKIQTKDLQKVVLARTCILELHEAPNPFAIAAALKQKAEGAFIFCIETPRGSFLGASPERLFSRSGKTIFSEAMAGTRKRGKTSEEDAFLESELLNSETDRREIKPVQDYLRAALSPFCETCPSFTPLSIHRTQNVQHLYSRCSAFLKESISDAEIASLLHPTPALAGSPQGKALSLIQELEPFDRGLYGGAIGWSTPAASEWIVGIRSCFLQGKTATLFSGTGIVEGSNAVDEWDELNQKIKLYDGIFQ
jgi:menaquinone-specific isochorismate synthase